MTTRHPEMDCPYCGHKFELTTEGILGGLFAQWFWLKVVQTKNKMGGIVQCGRCGKEFTIGPQKTKA